MWCSIHLNLEAAKDGPDVEVSLRGEGRLRVEPPGLLPLSHGQAQHREVRSGGNHGRGQDSIIILILSPRI